MYQIRIFFVFFTLLTFVSINSHSNNIFGYIGIGVIISKTETGIKIINTVNSSPACTAGLKKNDIITKINNKDTLEMELLYARNLLQGEIGSTVNIYIIREGEPEELFFEIQRAWVPLPPPEN